MNRDQTKARALALLALRDCAVIRVTIGQVPLGYRLLQRGGLLRAVRVPGSDDKADCRLTDAGEREIEL